MVGDPATSPTYSQVSLMVEWDAFGQLASVDRVFQTLSHRFWPRGFGSMARREEGCLRAGVLCRQLGARPSVWIQSFNSAPI